MATMGLDNDTRGWILCLVSGAACIVGASVVCVDIIVNLLPGKKNFRIQESNAFLACSLSLSFGVLLYSALCSMLPESKEYFKTKGWSDQSAGLVMMVLFGIGFVGIQAVSRVLHQHIPSHVVDCDHSHSEVATHDSHDHTRGRGISRSSHARKRPSRPSSAKMPDIAENRSADMSEVADADNHAQAVQPLVTETTPLLDAAHGTSLPPARYSSCASRPDGHKQTGSQFSAPSVREPSVDPPTDRRPSMYKVQKRVMSFVKDTKCGCDESGSCYGYTDPCAQECFKHLSSRASSRARELPALRTTTTHFHSQPDSLFAEHPSERAEEYNERPVSPHFQAGRPASHDTLAAEDDGSEHEGYFGHRDRAEDVEAQQQQHHHHVPTNAFLSIGLQTSLAIALHKFPEGFITFATNHTNPDLGFNVFLALFVHNITDGFAMCLPLYMALGSRLRAMGWTFLLGGLSQPLGAGIAALWLKLAKQTHLAPGPVAYACLFAMTAGIMVSVALQLFVEALSLNHNRNLCILFAFIGMALLGSSNALFSH